MTDQKHLCDTCIYERDSCASGKQAFGPKGAVIECDTYVSEGGEAEVTYRAEGGNVGKAETVQEALDKGATEVMVIPKPEELGNCSACGKPLIEIKVNSRVRAIVCKNPSCTLYYVKIRTYSISRPSPKLPPGQYWCTRCAKPHRETSDIGKRHLKYRKGR